MKNLLNKCLFSLLFALCFFAFALPSAKVSAAVPSASAESTDDKDNFKLSKFTPYLEFKGAAKDYYYYEALGKQYKCFKYVLYPGQKLKISDKILYKGSQVSFSNVKVKGPMKFGEVVDEWEDPDFYKRHDTKRSSDYTVIAAKTSGLSHEMDIYEITYKTSYKMDLAVYVVEPAVISSLQNVSSGIKINWGYSAYPDRATAGVIVYRSVNGGSYTKVKTLSMGTGGWTDTDATKTGAKYTYKLMTYVRFGTTSFRSEYSAAKSLYRVASPKINEVVNFSNGTCVKWNKVSGVSGYYIYRKIGNGSYSLVKTITNPATEKWTDTEATTEGQRYLYKMYAYKTISSTKYKSAPSTVSGVYRLSRPTITSKNGSIVKWTSNSLATGYNVLAVDPETKEEIYSAYTLKTSFDFDIYMDMSPEPDEYGSKKVLVSVRSYMYVGHNFFYSQYSPEVEMTIPVFDSEL